MSTFPTFDRWRAALLRFISDNKWPLISGGIFYLFYFAMLVGGIYLNTVGVDLNPRAGPPPLSLYTSALILIFYLTLPALGYHSARANQPSRWWSALLAAQVPLIPVVIGQAVLISSVNEPMIGLFLSFMLVPAPPACAVGGLFWYALRDARPADPGSQPGSH